MTKHIILRVPRQGGSEFTEYELKDTASQDRRKFILGKGISQPLPDVTQHNPANDVGIPISARDRDRVAEYALILRVPDSVSGLSGDEGWEYIQDDIHNIKRAIHGANSLALRHAMRREEQNRVHLRVKYDTQLVYDGWSDLPVKWGVLDDGRAAYSVVSENEVEAWSIPLTLVLEPYTDYVPITYRNMVPRSANCAVDSDSDGLADGWHELGTPTTTMETDNWLTAGQTQKVVATAIDDGVRTTNVAIVTGTIARGFVWVSVNPGVDLTIKLRDSTAASDLKTVNFDITDEGSYDRTLTSGNNTWYRVPFSGFVTVSNNVNIQVRSVTASDTFYVDMAYLEDGFSSSPVDYDGWVSTSTITNAENDNFLDVWGIPGDAMALVQQIKFDMTTVASSLGYLIATRFPDGHVFANDRYIFIDSADMSEGSGTATGTYTAAFAAASRAGGSYIKYECTGDGYKRATFSAADALDDLKVNLTAVRVFALVWCDATDASIRIDASSADFDSEEVFIETASTWEIKDLGLIMANGTSHELAQDGTTPMSIRFDVDNGDEFRLDGVFLMPVYDSIFMASGAPSDADDTAYILGKKREWFVDNQGNNQPYLGALWDVWPGRITTRFAFMWIGGTNEHSLTDATTVSLTLLPRAYHLFGEIVDTS